MEQGGDETDRIYERWLPDYTQRAQGVERELATLLGEAFGSERPGALLKNQGVTTSLQFLRKRRNAFPHPIVLFIYSSRFDRQVSEQLLDPAVTKAALPEGVTAQNLFDHKAEKLDGVFKAFVLCADVIAHHFVAALRSSGEGPRLPLVWEVPSEDEQKTGFSRDAMWWVNFQYLCEVARAVVAYGGLTQHLFAELSYIRRKRHLNKRLLWLDLNLNLFFPDRVEEQWPLQELPVLLERIESATASKPSRGARGRGRGGATP